MPVSLWGGRRMDKVILNVEDIERLLKWRDEHPEEVRGHPAPLKAVEIVLPHNGYRIKGIRDGNRLRLHLSQNYDQLGNCEFVRRTDGMWTSVKNRMKVDEDGLRSVLTVYCSLMALMAYGRAEREAEARPREKAAHKPSKKPSSKPKQRTTYILRMDNGTLLAAPSGSHASPSGTFTVRGHYRHYKSGKVVWIAEYKKGTGKKSAKTYKMGGKRDV